jgi:hypothetical protein
MVFCSADWMSGSGQGRLTAWHPLFESRFHGPHRPRETAEILAVSTGALGQGVVFFLLGCLVGFEEVPRCFVVPLCE